MNLDLLNFTTAQLCEELKERFSAVVIVGVDPGDMSKITEVYDGPAYAVAGLLQQGLMETMASIQKQIDQNED